MPLPFIADVIFKGPAAVIGLDFWQITKILVLLILIIAIKWYCSGASNSSERQMHSKVVIITGGTTGIGAATAYSLAKRGAQIVLLTHHPPTDPFLVEYIEDLRERTSNSLIYAEQVDLASTYSIRKFATKWIDNAPPRRLDMIILCAGTLTPPGRPQLVTSEGIEESWMVNYLGNFHLLSILSPAIRAQPPDRDVRIIFTTCSSYITSPPFISGEEALDTKEWTPARAYARSKLALMVFGHAFQKHLDSYKRPDGELSTARVIFVDPGYTRTAGTRRWFTRGTLWGLGLYLLLWQSMWLFLKSAEQGAQSILYAAMEASLGRGAGGKLIKECMEVDFARKEVRDEVVAKKLWESSEKLIERIEREEAVKRALAKKEAENSGTVKEGKDTEKLGVEVEKKKPKPRRSKKAT